jgi:hypothetical protein
MNRHRPIKREVELSQFEVLGWQVETKARDRYRDLLGEQPDD